MPLIGRVPSIGEEIAMGKLAFIFPGQGAQVVGMGKDLFDRYDLDRKSVV